MSDRYATAPGEDRTALVHLRPTEWPDPPRPGVEDALSDPAPADLVASLYVMLPQGAAWRTPDGAAFEEKSLLGGFLRSLTGALAATYRKLAGITLESTAVTLVDSLAEWEHDLGLPDPCLDEDMTTALRRRAAVAKVRHRGTVTPADFVALAATLGYTISIKEPKPFSFGGSAFGGTDQMIGGTLPGNAIQFHFVVTVEGVALEHFEFGASQYGLDRYLDFRTAADLECVFRRVAPAWTMPVFDYS
jgi:uncharacterized protein YmfQ (DUF2313 family)